MESRFYRTEEERLAALEMETESWPEFLAAMAQDHPDVARDIASRVETWQKEVDIYSGTAGLGEAIAAGMEYVPREEAEELIQGVAEEVTAILNQNPAQQIRFIAWDPNKGSGRWFYDQVIEQVSKEYHDSVRIVANYEVQESTNVTYFYLDDSANSGQQFNQSIFSLRGLINMRDKVEVERLKAEPLDFRVRLMRLTDEVRCFIEDPEIGQIREVEVDGEPLMTIDLNSSPFANKKMPTMEDVLMYLGIDEKDIQHLSAFVRNHHNRPPATLGIFAHKIQDNMPIVLEQGSIQTPVFPLITQENIAAIKPPYRLNEDTQV